VAQLLHPHSLLNEPDILQRIEAASPLTYCQTVCCN